jgi:hypothetical protein
MKNLESASPLGESELHDNGQASATSQIAKLHRGQVVDLVDGHDQRLGEVSVTGIEGDIVLGTLVPAPAYALIRQIFADHVEAVNNFCLSHAAKLEDDIAALGLKLKSKNGGLLPDIDDVQIGDDDFSCRIASAARN